MLCMTTVSAQTCRDDVMRDAYLAGSNYVAYPGPKTPLTPAPEGYEAVYLSHYGRHGSRYHIGRIYTGTYDIMRRAERAGMLTAKGKEVMQQVAMLRDEAAGRDGELTELGALQHQQIAERMYLNFPSIFGKKTHIDAKSTVVIRCILSMENALQKLKSLNPELDIRHDASYHDMWYMNHDDKGAEEARRKGAKAHADYTATLPVSERLMRELFSADTFWRDSINAGKLASDLYGLIMNVQSSEIRHRLDMTTLMTRQELYEQWQRTNSWWYINFGPSRLSDGRVPYSQAPLLRKMISEADSCLMLDNCGAHLRYGHDTMVMPLTCLMELDGLGRGDIDLARLDEEGWRDYQIFPMACNIQMVFYRQTPPQPSPNGREIKDAGNDILVKVLRNENEAHLPVKTDMWPYYKWSDVREYYLNKVKDPTPALPSREGDKEVKESELARQGVRK